MTYGTICMWGDVDRHERTVITVRGHVVGARILVPLNWMSMRRSFQLVLLIQILFCVFLQRLIENF